MNATHESNRSSGSLKRLQAHLGIVAEDAKFIVDAGIAAEPSYRVLPHGEGFAIFGPGGKLIMVNKSAIGLRLIAYNLNRFNGLSHISEEYEDAERYDCEPAAQQMGSYP